MKKILIAAAVLAAALTLFAGCGDKPEAPATIEGQWTSADGSVLSVGNGSFSLKDAMGRNMLAQESYPCDHRNDFLYISFGDVDAKVFEVGLEDDELTLKYTVAVQADMHRTYDKAIRLTRLED